MLHQNLTTLDDVSPVLALRADGKRICAELTNMGSKWTTKCLWKVGEPIGASEHKPTTSSDKKSLGKIEEILVQWRKFCLRKNSMVFPHYKSTLSSRLWSPRRPDERQKKLKITFRRQRFIECLSSNKFSRIKSPLSIFPLSWQIMWPTWKQSKKLNKSRMSPHVMAKVRKRNTLWSEGRRG